MMVELLRNFFVFNGTSYEVAFITLTSLLLKLHKSIYTKVNFSVYTLYAKYKLKNQINASPSIVRRGLLNSTFSHSTLFN